jgi:hypothetical protein
VNNDDEPRIGSKQKNTHYYVVEDASHRYGTEGLHYHHVSIFALIKET